MLNEYGPRRDSVNHPASLGSSTSIQVVSYYFPKLVELHNYAAANATDQKIYNWKALNDKVGRERELQLDG